MISNNLKLINPYTRKILNINEINVYYNLSKLE